MSEEKNLIAQETLDKMKTALETLSSIEEIEITNAEQNLNAGGIQRDVQGAIKTVEALRKEAVKPFDEKRKVIQKEFMNVLNQLKAGKDKIGSAMIDFDNAEKRRIALEQKKLEAEAEEKRRKAEKAAEAEAAKIEKYQSEGKEELAEKAQARMEDKIEEATTTVATEIKQEKVSGVSYRTDYVVEVEDHFKAIPFLLENSLTSHLIGINVPALKAMVKASKGVMTIPGVKIKKTQTQIVRS